MDRKRGRQQSGPRFESVLLFAQRADVIAEPLGGNLSEGAIFNHFHERFLDLVAQLGVAKLEADACLLYTSDAADVLRV